MLINNSNLNDNQLLWKYLNLEKFLSILTKNQLCFCRQDILQKIDPYEGAYSKMELIVLNALEKCSISNYDISDYITSINKTYIDCWHINDFESIGMWNSFASEKNSIAIVSTPKLLCESINTDYKITMNRVIYEDLDSSTDISKDVLYRKNKYFEYENELRLSFESNDNLDSVKFINIDFVKTIDFIVLSPNYDEWFIEVLESILNKFNINSCINKSLISKNNLSKDLLKDYSNYINKLSIDFKKQLVEQHKKNMATKD